MVLKTDGIPAGEVTRWEWNCTNGTGIQRHAILKEFRIKICHTSRSALAPPFISNYEGRTPTQVYYAAQETVDPYPYNTWFGWDFTPTFAYNGADNLIIEVWWEGAGNDGGPYCWTTSGFTGRSIYASIMHDEPQNGYPDGGLAAEMFFYNRITITGLDVAPTSLGRVKAMYR